MFVSPWIISALLWWPRHGRGEMEWGGSRWKKREEIVLIRRPGEKTSSNRHVCRVQAAARIFTNHLFVIFKTAKWDLNSDLTWHAVKHLFSRLADLSCDRAQWSITPFSREAVEVKRLGRDYLRSAMRWPGQGTICITHSDGQIWPIRADNIRGFWNCYSVIRVMVGDEGMKILILTRDDEDMETWSY